MTMHSPLIKTTVLIATTAQLPTRFSICIGMIEPVSQDSLKGRDHTPLRATTRYNATYDYQMIKNWTDFLLCFEVMLLIYT